MSACLNHAEACAAVAARFDRRWLRHYAASKLRSDPVFPAAAELLANSSAPLLDIGCGIGLLPLYLQARGIRTPVLGLDVDARKLREARRLGLEVLETDARVGLPQFSGNVALLDVLHYLEPARQAALLSDAAARIPVDGMLLLRDALRDGSLRCWATYASEKFAQAISWNLRASVHFLTRRLLDSVFPPEQFVIEERPMHGRTPFNNRLWIVRRVAGRDGE